MAMLAAAAPADVPGEAPAGPRDNPGAFAVPGIWVVLWPVAVLAEVKGDNHHVLTREDPFPLLHVPQGGVDAVRGRVLDPRKLAAVEGPLEGAGGEAGVAVAVALALLERLDSFRVVESASAPVEAHPGAETGADWLEAPDVGFAMVDLLEDSVLDL